MSSPFKQIQVFFRPDNSRVIGWQFTPDIEIPEGSVLSLQYARSGGTWQTLSNNIKDTYCYTDSRKTNYNKLNNDFYRLKLTCPDTSCYYSQPVQAGATLCYPYSSKAKNLIRLAQLQIDQTGREGYLMKKITFGQKCPKCKQFDDDSPVNEHCPICLGTGINKGYYNAIPLNILQQGDSNMEALTAFGHTQVSVLSAKCVAWPIIGLGDIWCDKYTNQRYYIQSATILSKFKHVPLIYRLKMHLIQLTDIIHSQPADKLLQQALITIQPSSWEKEFME